MQKLLVSEQLPEFKKVYGHVKINLKLDISSHLKIVMKYSSDSRKCQLVYCEETVNIIKSNKVLLVDLNNYLSQLLVFQKKF